MAIQPVQFGLHVRKIHVGLGDTLFRFTRPGASCARPAMSWRPYSSDPRLSSAPRGWSRFARRGGSACGEGLGPPCVRDGDCTAPLVCGFSERELPDLSDLRRPVRSGRDRCHTLYRRERVWAWHLSGVGRVRGAVYGERGLLAPARCRPVYAHGVGERLHTLHACIDEVTSRPASRCRTASSQTASTS